MIEGHPQTIKEAVMIVLVEADDLMSAADIKHELVRRFEGTYQERCAYIHILTTKTNGLCELTYAVSVLINLDTISTYLWEWRLGGIVEAWKGWGDRGGYGYCIAEGL